MLWSALADRVGQQGFALLFQSVQEASSARRSPETKRSVAWARSAALVLDHGPLAMYLRVRGPDLHAASGDAGHGNLHILPAIIGDLAPVQRDEGRLGGAAVGGPGPAVRPPVRRAVAAALHGLRRRLGRPAGVAVGVAAGHGHRAKRRGRGAIAARRGSRPFRPRARGCLPGLRSPGAGQ